MRVLALVWIAVLFVPSAAHANPWPREKGQIFTAFSGTYRYASNSRTVEFDGDAYVEYGLTARTTLGVSANDNQIDYSHGYVFVRHAFSPPDQQFKLAAHLALGASRRDLDWGPMARVGFSAGRGTDFWKQGWWSVTAAVEHHELWPDPLYKIDATFGLNLTPRLKAILDLETSQRRDSTDVFTLRGSVAWAVRERTHLVVGLEAKEVNETFLGLRVGIWQTF